MKDNNCDGIQKEKNTEAKYDLGSDKRSHLKHVGPSKDFFSFTQIIFM